LAAAPAQTVRKTAESFDDTAWPVDAWNKAVGSTSLAADASPAAPAGKSLQIDVRFSGHGFEWFGVSPAEPLVIPGDAKSVAFHYRLGDKRYPLILKFKDGWGRAAVGPKKLEWAVPADKPGQWSSARFQVPADWIRPVTVAGFATHNWEAQNDARTVHFWIDQLEVETDTSAVDPETGLLAGWKPDPQPKDAQAVLREPPRAPLVSVEFATGQPSNVFAGQPPSVTVRIRSWKPGTLTGPLKVTVADDTGRTVEHRETPVTVESTAAMKLAWPLPRFGLYALAAELALSDGTQRKGRVTFAHLPPPHTLSDRDKQASPYGINVNGGRANATVEPFRRAGIVWFRDYAFSYDWLLRAKGDDRRYAGWPWYPTIMQRYEAAGVKVLPCLMKSIAPPTGKPGQAGSRMGPDRAWVRNIADIVNSFPQITHWELDNEYDLNKSQADAEVASDWQNYRMYHRRFAEIVRLLGDGQAVAVEQGQAGIWPQRIAQCVQSGDFAQIGVVNSHYYCGAEPPERNIANWNTGFEGDWRAQRPQTFFDQLRAAKRAAASDGRRRESWLTEFGWDSLAGPKVSAYQQAVYLARGFLLALAAGTDKCFWFYDYDAPEPKQFFDGCGLLAADGSPKLALCAMAGLTAVLPRPHYVGSINAGPGTCGHVFSSGDDLVAALWSVEAERGPTVTIRARELRDYLGNPLAGNTVALTTAPVYAVGLDRSDVWYRQAACELASPQLVEAAVGDTVTAQLDVRNDGQEPLVGTVTAELPAGWSAQPAVAFRVAPGQSQSVAVPFVVGGGEPRPLRDAALRVQAAKLEKRIPLQVLVQPPLSLQVDPLPSRPGPSQVKMRVGNRSSQPLDGTLRLALPASWKAEPREIAVRGLQRDEVRPVECAVTWDARGALAERALVEFDAGSGRKISRSLIPGRIPLLRVETLTLDGRADDWPAAARLPAWLLGCTRGEAGVGIALGWNAAGLHALVEVPEADLENPDPRSFWTTNCLELFVDVRDDKRERGFAPGDHQFWFVPLVAEKRVYAGQWKRGDETPQTRYDIPGVAGVALRQGRGFVMEFRLPATELHGWTPAAGKTIGLSLSLSIRAGQASREVYWPRPKSAGMLTQPGVWGSVELASP
jgi:hypothetical protein